MGKWLEVRQRAYAAVDEGVTPALALRVVQGGEVRFGLDVGRTHPDSAGTLCDAETRFDLASLTKPLTTWTWLLRSVQTGALSLDTPIGHAVEVDDPELSACPLHRLLSHTTGLPAHRAYFTGLLAYTRQTGNYPETKRLVRSMIARTPLEAAPGVAEVYSDLGFLLLEQVVERFEGPLEAAWRGLPFHEKHRLHFRPLLGPVRAPSSVDLSEPPIAATERCALRGGLVCGQVHDENAWTLGGVAGHAGLFGRADDVAAFGVSLVEALQSRTNDLGLDAPLLAEALSRRWVHPRGSRVLGWDTPAVVGSSAGRRFGPRSFGHLGFTGTSIWIDPDAEVVIVLLTNRVCPSRADTRIRALRPALHDAAWAALHD